MDNVVESILHEGMILKRDNKIYIDLASFSYTKFYSFKIDFKMI